MTTITFDTLKFTQILEKSGIPHEQAVAMAEAQRESLAEIMVAHVVTKQDVQDIKYKQIEHDGQFTLLKWMLGVLIAGMMAVVVKLFV